ncbi:hypothetical protein [Gordonia rubripertincta]|uniref:Uncharacterized protein n=1 Tax=Gordonia rubripertincta TaxID=36822 RepID=A0ABT4MXI6_GORRU|nr:hypothetical protein [Gordonia rubripertincta]MCZ4551706.1 hypothetical protein [Gordonia rubripertincta]
MAKNVEARALTVHGKPLVCVVCQTGTTFFQREVMMNTVGMSMMGWDWANATADGAICATCGFVHTFMGNAHAWA